VIEGLVAHPSPRKNEAVRRGPDSIIAPMPLGTKTGSLTATVIRRVLALLTARISCLPALGGALTS
jgi:hypothetical protein